jgi:hypothetical protein
MSHHGIYGFAPRPARNGEREFYGGPLDGGVDTYPATAKHVTWSAKGSSVIHQYARNDAGQFRYIGVLVDEEDGA